jgi:hypothetical protein
MSLDDVYAITETVCRELGSNLNSRPVAEIVQEYGNEVFTTGDALFDQALGGGIRLGMLWEFCGEKYCDFLA